MKDKNDKYRKVNARYAIQNDENIGIGQFCKAQVQTSWE